MKYIVDTAVTVRVYIEDDKVTGVEAERGWAEPSVSVVDEEGVEIEVRLNSDAADDAMLVMAAAGPWSVQIGEDDPVSKAATFATMALYEALVEDVARKLTCGEAEALADLYRALGHPADAEEVIHAHALGDDDEDDQHHNVWLWDRGMTQ